MKKFLTIFLIALCCVSVFAVDISAEVALHLSLDKDGFHYSVNEPWEPMIKLSVSGSNAGASIAIKPSNLFETVNFDTSLWVKPAENLKITVGSRQKVSFTNGFDASQLMEYGTLQYFISEISDLNIGFGYQPGEKNAFIAAESNIGIDDFGTLHADVLAKVDFENKKPSLNYALSEFTYSNSLEDENSLVKYNKYGISGCFENTENEFFSYQQDWMFHNDVWTFPTRLTAGFRYKYYTEFAKGKENGLYGYGFVQYSEGSKERFTAEAEIGRYVADLKLGNYYTEKGNAYMANAITYFDWSNGSLSAKLDEVVGWFTHPINEGVIGTFKLSVDYLNKDSYSAQDNGFFVTPEINGNIGECKYSTKFRLGADSLKNFQWKVSEDLTVDL